MTNPAFKCAPAGVECVRASPKNSATLSTPRRSNSNATISLRLMNAAPVAFAALAVHFTKVSLSLRAIFPSCQSLCGTIEQKIAVAPFARASLPYFRIYHPNVCRVSFVPLSLVTSTVSSPSPCSDGRSFAAGSSYLPTSLCPNWIKTKSPFFISASALSHRPSFWNVRLERPPIARLTTFIFERLKNCASSWPQPRSGALLFKVESPTIQSVGNFGSRTCDGVVLESSSTGRASSLTCAIMLDDDISKTMIERKQNLIFLCLHSQQLSPRVVRLLRFADLNSVDMRGTEHIGTKDDRLSIGCECRIRF